MNQVEAIRSVPANAGIWVRLEGRTRSRYLKISRSDALKIVQRWGNDFAVHLEHDAPERGGRILSAWIEAQATAGSDSGPVVIHDDWH